MTVNKKCHDGTGRWYKDGYEWTGWQIKIITTGRDGIHFFVRRDGTVHVIFHDGTGRYKSSCTTGRVGTSTFSTARDGTFWFLRRDATVRIFFHCTGEHNARTHCCSRHQGISVTSYTSYDIIRYHTYNING